MTAPSAPLSPAPLFHFDLSTPNLGAFQINRGRPRILRHAGRSGVVFDDIHASLILGPHHLAENAGTLVLWVMALEDLHPAAKCPNQSLNVPDAEEFTLISDRDTVKDSRAAHFSLVWVSRWTPGFYVKRYPGHIYDGFKKPRKAGAAAGHFPFPKGVWIQLTYTWNTAENRHRIYADGVLVAHEDAHASQPLAVSRPGPFLCIGSTMFAHHSVRGFAGEWDEAACRRFFEEEALPPEIEHRRKLEQTFAPVAFEKFSPPADPAWQSRLKLALTDPSDLLHFHIQGCPNAPSIDADGLRITTAPGDPLHSFDVLDLSHVYLWTRQFFEGDLHVRYEFQNLKRGGLSLLMLQCSGMQRDDFWLSHTPRTNGIMKTVCWEDVRNYHWEYLREMDDVRNDVASHAMLKNPWQQALGFRIHGPLYPLGQWHTLDFLQVGPRLQCAINGDVVIDALDCPDQNHGPVLSAGRIAIRCMTRTDLRIRNLEIKTKSHWDA
jgi:hypothetical protein